MLSKKDISTKDDRPNTLDNLANALEKIIKDIYGDNMGFALFIFPFSDKEGQCDYVSNAERVDMIRMLKNGIDQIQREIKQPQKQANVQED